MSLPFDRSNQIVVFDSQFCAGASARLEIRWDDNFGRLEKAGGDSLYALQSFSLSVGAYLIPKERSGNLFGSSR